MDLPLDIMTDKGVVHLITPKKGVRVVIKSRTPPVIDPKGYYYKQVLLQ